MMPTDSMKMLIELVLGLRELPQKGNPDDWLQAAIFGHPDFSGDEKRVHWKSLKCVIMTNRLERKDQGRAAAG